MFTGRRRGRRLAALGLEAEEDLVERARSRAGAELRRRPGGDQRTLPEQEQVVAPLGLVHHVARDEQRRPLVGEPMEELPEVAAEQRVEPDRRLVQHEQLGVGEERDRERDAGPLAARQPRDDPASLRAERDGIDHLVAAGGPEPVEPAEVAKVLADREVGVDRRRLGHVADPAPQRGRPGRLAEHGHVTARNLLDADDGAQERRLAAAARPEQPGDAAGADLE